MYIIRYKRLSIDHGIFISIHFTNSTLWKYNFLTPRKNMINIPEKKSTWIDYAILLFGNSFFLLSFTSIGVSLGNSVSHGLSTIWLDGVQCSGSESTIAGCRHNAWGVHDCHHYEDVGVRCFRLKESCGK